MKKLSSIIFCLVFFSISLDGQEIEHNYFQYYQNIYNAEKEICNHNIERALELYDSTFNIYENLFYYDLYNAALCASQLKKYQELDKILQHLAGYGYDVEFIGEEIFTQLDSLHNYQYVKILNKLKSTFEKNIDTNLAVACSLRVENDQALNRQRMSDGKGESYKAFHDTIYKNMEWLVRIIDSCGYPNREQIGYAYEPTYSVVGIMIIHYFQHKSMKAFPEKDKELMQFMWKYEEQPIINRYDSIPVLKIIANEVKTGNMNLGAYIKYHNFLRRLNEGKYFYKVFYHSDKWPAIFSEEEDAVLMQHSKELYSLIDTYKKQGETEFTLGESLYKLEILEDYKHVFDSKFGKKD